MSKIKICGLRRMEDIEAVNHALPNYIGFVFAESRRRINADTAARLKEKLDTRIRSVGVFVNQDVSYITNLCRDSVIDLVQLHGDEDEAYIRQLREHCGCPVIKVVSVGNVPPSLPAGTDYLMFDTASEQRGGAGKTFDWNLLKGYNGPPYFLAGGLTPENAEAAVRLLSPFCVDVSSGVETDGFKDPDKIDRFVRTIRRI